jgi:hypothetical protein
MGRIKDITTLSGDLTSNDFFIVDQLQGDGTYSYRSISGDVLNSIILGGKVIGGNVPGDIVDLSTAQTLTNKNLVNWKLEGSPIIASGADINILAGAGEYNISWAHFEDTTGNIQSQINNLSSLIKNNNIYLYTKQFGHGELDGDSIQIEASAIKSALGVVTTSLQRSIAFSVGAIVTVKKPGEEFFQCMQANLASGLSYELYLYRGASGSGIEYLDSLSIKINNSVVNYVYRLTLTLQFIDATKIAIVNNPTQEITS